ncbi:hypothetical protein TSAR_010276, partial [Trichomalopsis sarcophagae]
RVTSEDRTLPSSAGVRPLRPRITSSYYRDFRIFSKDELSIAILVESRRLGGRQRHLGPL